MSDTANPANLASSEEFDARLKRTDEPRWLATRYASAEARQRLVAIYLLHQELGRTLSTKEAMLGKIRIQWWRETVEQIAGKGALRRHDLSEELGRLIAQRPDLIAAINDLIDRFDDILDDHLRAGGHEAGGAHEARHLEAEASLMRLAGLALNSNLTSHQLDVLSRCGESHLATVADMEDAADRWVTAQVASRELPADTWPAILHLVAAAPKGRQRSPFSQRWRMFRAMLTRKLGKRS